MAKRKIKYSVEECSGGKQKCCELLGTGTSCQLSSDESNSATLKLWLEIFPDGEPEYFNKKYIQIKDDDMQIEEFVAECLDKRDYPKKKAKDCEKNIVDEKEKTFYVEFSVEKFVERFPDAIKYFLDENRSSQIPTDQAFEYACGRFRDYTIRTIKQHLKSSKNFALACLKISQSMPDRLTLRPHEKIVEIKEPTLELLQEMTFVEHYNEIFDYIELESQRRTLAYNQAKTRGELVECGCCYDEVLFEESTVCEDGDIFCKNCVQKNAEIRIGEGHTSFPCLRDCGASFSLHILEAVLRESVFSKLLKRKQSKEVQAAGITGLETCPFCEFATIPPPETRIFTCLNPECGKESCRLCWKVSHVPLRCHEVESDEEVKKRTFIENKMTEALVRTCWKCKAQFVKEYGCNKMQCSCGATMCYICRKPVTDYRHFNEGLIIDKCPLYSSDNILHVDVIKAVGEQAKRMVGVGVSNVLKNDPTKIKISNRGINKSSVPMSREGANRLKNQIINNVFRSDYVAKK